MPASLKNDCVKDWREAQKKVESFLQKDPEKEDLILVKGSQSIELGKMVEGLV